METDETLWERVKNNPALLTGAVLALALFVKGMGWVQLTDDQTGSLSDFILAVVALAGGAVVRHQVTPNARVLAKRPVQATPQSADPGTITGQAGPAAETAGVAVEDEPVTVESATDEPYEPKHDIDES